MQELHNTPYFCQTEDTDMFDLAEPVPGPSTGFYSELAAGYGIVLVTSLFEKRAPGLYHNTAVVFDKDGSIAGKYRKMHIPDDPAYYEKFYFTPGDLGFEPIQTSLGKLGVQVCWDQWYPEGARLMALKGAEILIYPTAIGWESTDTQEEKIRQLGAWVTVQRGHAVANGLPVIAVNRVGHEPDPSGQTNGIQFWGNSFVAGPQGEILAQASNMDEENIFLSLFAKKNSKAKLITKVNRIAFDDIIDGLDIGSVIYPKYITADYILQYVRAMENSLSSNVETLYHILDNQAEALEFSVKEASSVTDIPLSQLNLKENLLIACINRNGSIQIPRGQDTIQVGDTVIIVTSVKGLRDLKDILKK